MHRVPQEAPEAIAALMTGCLHIDPHRRPSAVDIVARLKSYAV